MCTVYKRSSPHVPSARIILLHRLFHSSGVGALEVPLEFRGLHAYEASCSGAEPLKPILGSIVPSFVTLRREG